MDFILYGEQGFYALEVKNSSYIRPADLRSLYPFGTDYPECKLYFLYGGKEILKKGNIICSPVEYFLKQLIPSKPIFDQV